MSASRVLLRPSRFQSTATATREESYGEISQRTIDRTTYAHLPSPPPQTASSSAKLSALHARLSLSSRLPLETLARCLIDPSADPHPSFNNSSLSILGNDIIGYHSTESILCRYPRLPTAVIFAAINAYCGPAAAASITREWGVDIAAAPGGEVDPGLLQFVPVVAGNADIDGTGILVKNAKTGKAKKPWNRGITTLTTTENYFGDRGEVEYGLRPDLGTVREEAGITFETAALGFVRAVTGAVYLHSGRAAAKAFYNAHIASRKLDVSKLFEFRQPTRDLSRLCAREGFESPVARIISETGRHSRTPVYVVGVFSGNEKLGEATGGSLDEARIRAAIAALKGWYLYSPVEVRVPSDVEGGGGKPWQPVLIDGGEVIV